jgi:hypothetical protein
MYLLSRQGHVSEEVVFFNYYSPNLIVLQVCVPWIRFSKSYESFCIFPAVLESFKYHYEDELIKLFVAADGFGVGPPDCCCYLIMTGVVSPLKKNVESLLIALPFEFSKSLAFFTLPI